MGELLKSIGGPADLKKVPPEDLPRLAEEIREAILETVFETGGHLASNLGVVELTIALHYAYDFPRDRLVMDVGHQAYPHKLLTGRQDRFHTIRQGGGLSGFTSKFESPYDLYLCGHAGTSISCGLGLSAGDHLLEGDDRHTVVLIGDSSIGAGMAFEALNHAGEIGRNLLVVLNDNRMSISRTTGALTRYLSRIRTGSLYQEIDKDVQGLLSLVPIIGEHMERGYEHLKDAVKAGMLPGQLFENLGFRYYGPVDGHDLDELLPILDDLRDIEGPRLLHVRTEKGHGHESAAAHPRKYHGVSPKKDKVSKSGRTEPTPSWTKVFGDALIELAREDESIVTITAAMPDGTGTRSFREEFPDRYFDVGICEQHAVALASGMAVSGLKPVAAIYSTFLQRGYDQVFHDVCLQKNRVLFCMDRAGIVGADGATHNGVFDLAFLRTLPNIVLMAPADMAELMEMMRLGLAIDGPSAIRYPRCSAVPPLTLGRSTPVELGKAVRLREGGDGVFLAYGSMVAPALEAAKGLAEKGMEIGVVNARFCKPLDTDLIDDLARKHPFIITAEEHMIAGGFGSAVLEHLSTRPTPSRVRVMGIPDEFLEHASRADLLARFGLDVDGMTRAAEEMVHAAAPGPWQ